MKKGQRQSLVSILSAKAKTLEVVVKDANVYVNVQLSSRSLCCYQDFLGQQNFADKFSQMFKTEVNW